MRIALAALALAAGGQVAVVAQPAGHLPIPATQRVALVTGSNTTMIASAGLTPRSTVEEGAAAVMHAIGTDAPSGSYFLGQTLATPHVQAADAGARRQLHEVSRRLTGVP